MYMSDCLRLLKQDEQRLGTSHTLYSRTAGVFSVYSVQHSYLYIYIYIYISQVVFPPSSLFLSIYII